MRLGEKKDILSPKSDERRNSILPIIRAYLTALLLLTPSLQMRSEAKSSVPQKQLIGGYENDVIDKTDESKISYEIIFRDGMRKALQGINAINQIPVGGKKITYYWNDGPLKGKQLSVETMKKLNLPDKFDISPRYIDPENPVSSMVLHLGNRKFEITPDIGNIQNVTLTEKELIITTTILGFTITYDKEKKLPDLLSRLRKTPVGKGEKKGFRLSTVKEI